MRSKEWRTLAKDRDHTICILVTSGITMTTVGNEFGLTRERIRQIVLRDTKLSGHEIQASLKAEKSQKRLESDFHDSVKATLRNNWKCNVCGGWNVRKGYAYIRGIRNANPFERCSHECTKLYEKLRFRFDRDSYNKYQAMSILNRDTSKFAKQHAENILSGVNVVYENRYYTQSGSMNEVAVERVALLRKALGTEHLFDDSLPLRVLNTNVS